MPGRITALVALVLFYVVVPIIGIYYFALTINTRSIVFAIATVMYVCVFMFLGLLKLTMAARF